MVLKNVFSLVIIATVLRESGLNRYLEPMTMRLFNVDRVKLKGTELETRM